MKSGHFTALAKEYKNRPGYSETVLMVLARYTNAFLKGFRVADVGAGTGKLTQLLVKMGLQCTAIEPNDEMRSEGINETLDHQIEWRKGTGEETGLENSSVNWVLMASSFHWTDKKMVLAEFYRILRPKGYFTALWNPRDLQRSPLQSKIESMIYDIVPGLNRVSSGASKYTENLFQELVSTGHFTNGVFVEAEHEVVMSRERYLGVWKSVNDIQVQAGPERWEKILNAIEKEIQSFSEIVVPYKTRAWTVERVD